MDGLGGPLFLSAFATFTMLLGVLYSQLFPRWGSQRRVFEFGAAIAGTAFVILLSVTSIVGIVRPLLPIVVGALLLVLGGVIFLAASRGRYFGTVSDYRIIGRTLLVAGGAGLALGVVVLVI